ncbi:hypothetical protein BHE74_00029381 [Ensete ventricosum]|nr:hypothetical protein GW17_00047120 [Ensete ventricosum]RWW63437.1 hypothetical protein BHE74_00029381 [Ensete ventricosum]
MSRWTAANPNLIPKTQIKRDERVGKRSRLWEHARAMRKGRERERGRERGWAGGEGPAAVTWDEDKGVGVGLERWGRDASRRARAGAGNLRWGPAAV